MGSADDSQTSGRGRRSKVARLIEEYDLDGLGADLERLWTAEDDRRSLRDLASYFNGRLLRRRLADADVQVLDGEAENVYRLLTDDDVSRAERTRVRRRLERDGVDVETLEDDFVTYQAIRTYLKQYRGAEYAPDERDPLEREAEALEQLRGRVAAVTKGKIEGLRDDGQLSLEDFRTLVSVQIVCEECNTQWDIFDLLDRGGCKCSDS
jgi:hypothetical protein